MMKNNTKNAFLITRGSKEGEMYFLSDKGQTIVGRGEQCDIQIHDSGISRRHFCITKQDGKYFLQDMGSANGTFINGNRTLWQELHEDDYIVCGSSEIKFTKVEVPEENNQVQSFPIHLKNAQIRTCQTQEIERVSALHKYTYQELPNNFMFQSLQTPPAIEDIPHSILIQKPKVDPLFVEYKDIDRLRKSLATLYKVSELLHSSIEVQDLWQHFLETVLSITEAQRSCLIFRKTPESELEISTYVTCDQSNLTMMSISKTIVNLAIEKGVATISADAMNDQRFHTNDNASVILQHIRSVLCVPLEVKERTLGAIYVDSLDNCAAFSNEDLELMVAIGRQAGLAIERTMLQAKILRSEQKYRTIFQRSPLAISLVNPTGRIVDINTAGLLEINATSEEEILGKLSILEVFPKAKEEFQKLLQFNESFDLKEFATHENDPNSKIVNLKGIPLLNDNQQLEGALIISEDITEAKKLQTQLIQQDKMATVGLLAAGIAHEFNNIVAGMMGYAQLMQMGKKSPEKLAEVIVEQCRRARELIERLLNFSRRKDTPLQNINIQDILEEVFQLVEREFTKNNITIQKRYTPIPYVMAHAGEMQQVFLNLMINALHAMGKDGTLTVTLFQDNRVVKILFQDTGCGIPSHILPKIFEPFFTTKDQKGTGLGLSVIYNIIKSYNGDITVSSQENIGTTFTIEIPVPSVLEHAPISFECYEETEKLSFKDIKEQVIQDK